jgi:uncharacterized protein (TIGR02246 family)
MNRKTPFALALSLALAGAAVAQAKDETEIKGRVEAFAAAWNKHDVKALTAMWTADGDLIDPFGSGAKGRAEIEKFWQQQHATGLKGTTYTVAGQTIRMLKPDIAIAEWDGTITGLKSADGKDLPALKHHVTIVLAKEASQWLFVAARPVVYAPPPGSGANPKPAK